MKLNSLLRVAFAALAPFSLTGCFSYMVKMPTWKSDRGPSTCAKAVYGLMDIATAPVQVPVWVILGMGREAAYVYWSIPVDILADFDIYADKFDRRRFYGLKRLRRNPGVAFEDPAFLSEESTGEREALKELLDMPEEEWGFSDFQIECLAELIGEKKGLADEFRGIWKSDALTPAHRRRFLEAVHAGRVNCWDTTLNYALHHACVTESWLTGLPWNRGNCSEEEWRAMGAVGRAVASRLYALREENERRLQEKN